MCALRNEERAFSSARTPNSEGMSSHLSAPGIMSVSFCVRKGLGVHTRLGTGGLNQETSRKSLRLHSVYPCVGKQQFNLSINTAVSTSGQSTLNTQALLISREAILIKQSCRKERRDIPRPDSWTTDMLLCIKQIKIVLHPLRALVAARSICELAEVGKMSGN